jgi:hypothetical protein
LGPTQSINNKIWHKNSIFVISKKNKIVSKDQSKKAGCTILDFKVLKVFTITQTSKALNIRKKTSPPKGCLGAMKN